MKGRLPWIIAIVALAGMGLGLGWLAWSLAGRVAPGPLPPPPPPPIERSGAELRAPEVVAALNRLLAEDGASARFSMDGAQLVLTADGQRQAVTPMALDMSSLSTSLGDGSHDIWLDCQGAAACVTGEDPTRLHIRARNDISAQLAALIAQLATPDGGVPYEKP